jgi:hypothetical protein
MHILNQLDKRIIKSSVLTGHIDGSAALAVEKGNFQVL